eukprot:5519112-Alexandrium_andersonii.AAC.1
MNNTSLRRPHSMPLARAAREQARASSGGSIGATTSGEAIHEPPRRHPATQPHNSAKAERAAANGHQCFLPFCCARRPAPNVYRRTYFRRGKPLAAVCGGLQRFAARPPRGDYRPPDPPPKKRLRRAPEALFDGDRRGGSRFGEAALQSAAICCKRFAAPGLPLS